MDQRGEFSSRNRWPNWFRVGDIGLQNRTSEHGCSFVTGATLSGVLKRLHGAFSLVAERGAEFDTGPINSHRPVRTGFEPRGERGGEPRWHPPAGPGETGIWQCMKKIFFNLFLFFCLKAELRSHWNYLSGSGGCGWRVMEKVYSMRVFITAHLNEDTLLAKSDIRTHTSGVNTKKMAATLHARTTFYFKNKIWEQLSLCEHTYFMPTSVDGFTREI